MSTRDPADWGFVFESLVGTNGAVCRNLDLRNGNGWRNIPRFRSLA